MPISIAYAAGRGALKAGIGLGKYAYRNPKKAMGLLSAGIVASQMGNFSQDQRGVTDTTSAGGYFTAPSDTLKTGIQLYGENPVTAIAAGLGVNWLLSKYSSGAGLTDFAKSFSAKNPGLIDPMYIKNFERRMSAVDRLNARGTGAGTTMGSKIRHGLKNAFRLVRGDASAMIEAEKLITNTPGVAGSIGGNALKGRINLLNKAKKVSNIAMFAWAGQMAFDLGKGFFSTAQPTFNVPTVRTTAMGGTFNDSSEAHTQRRRAIEAMHNSQFSGRSAFGNEASLMHA